MAAESYALHNRGWAATARIQAALQNATKPSASNGGQQVTATDDYAGYAPSKLGALATSRNALKVTLDLSKFASTPSVLSADNKTGWYANDILQEVAAKTGQDATGYKLEGSEFDVNEPFGRGKAFPRLETFVIRQQPTITLTFTGADVSRVTSDLEVGASLKGEPAGPLHARVGLRGRTPCRRWTPTRRRAHAGASSALRRPVKGASRGAPRRTAP